MEAYVIQCAPQEVQQIVQASMPWLYTTPATLYSNCFILPPKYVSKHDRAVLLQHGACLTEVRELEFTVHLKNACDPVSDLRDLASENLVSVDRFERIIGDLFRINVYCLSK